MRHTSFSFALDIVASQEAALRRHAGAARFAFNQCLTFVKTALAEREKDPKTKVPWSGFDLINRFNAWKNSAAAGVDGDGHPGLPWRREVLAQVFEEAAVDLSRGLAAFIAARKAGGTRRSGFPRYKKRGRDKDSFRMRNGGGGVRVGLQSIRLPKLGELPVRESTRRLRRLLRVGEDGKPRAKILFATVSQSAGRWYVRLNVEAPAFHPRVERPVKPLLATVGIDRGLKVFAVAATADGREVWRSDAPKPLAANLRRLRRLSRALSRKQRDSANRQRARQALAKQHARIRYLRDDHVHKLSTYVAKTHGHVALEDLHIAGMLKNRCLSRGIADSGWGLFATRLRYKAAWYGCSISTVDRFAPTTKRCSQCHVVTASVPLSVREFSCEACGYRADRDTNAAANCAQWAEAHVLDVAVKRTETKNVCGGAGSGRTSRCDETSLDEAKTASYVCVGRGTSEKDGVGRLTVNTL